MMDWGKLLTNERIGVEYHLLKDVEHFMQKKGYGQSDFEKDYSNIIHSASYRRLQDKTQVFPLDKSDFVRTRLTHSIEVSTVAKQLGTMAVSIIKKKSPNGPPDESIKDIPDILMCAGLLHDIGNPPFGHFGETVIGEWFRANLDKLKFNGKVVSNMLTAQMKEDLCTFDGNAQSLRLVSKLHYLNNDNGMNLTCAVLNTLIKYPRNSIYKKDDKDNDVKNKKTGYYLADREVFNEITAKTGAGDSRHPLAFLLEAADDIAYHTADIEDGYKKGLYTFAQLEKFIFDRLKNYKTEMSGQQFEKTKEAFDELSKLKEEAENKFNGCKEVSCIELLAVQNWLKYLQNWLIYCAAYGFDSNYEAIKNGKYKNDLLHGTNHEYTIQILKDLMCEYIFPNANILKLELSGKSILEFLLDRFVNAFLYYDTDVKLKKADEKITKLLSDNYIAEYKKASEGKKDEAEKLYLRLLLVTDYLSGMTDSFARELYRELSGII